MSFRSKRLLVQLPCGEPGSMVDAEELRRSNDGAGMTPPACNWVYNTPAPCWSLTCFDVCQPGLGTLCDPHTAGGGGPQPQCPAGFITPDLHCPHGTISLPGCPNTAVPHCWFGASCALDSCRHRMDTGRCRWDSCHWDTGCLDTIPILVEADDGGSVFLDARGLPLLRRELERRLGAIEAAEQAKEGLQARLEEIDRAERRLRESGDGDE